MTTITRRADIEPYITLDASEIRELMHPGPHGNVNQSLAEATVPPGARTHLHRHRVTEEIYHVTAGTGWMVHGATGFRVSAGDSIVIPPGTPHCVHNDGASDLVILCACSPAYSHDDTELLDPDASTGVA
jgi:mannose-6-phosphate isomerase-like protein (cupin superfamily)